MSFGVKNRMQQHQTSAQLFWWERKRKKKSQVAKIQTKQSHGYRINPLISGSTTNNCQFCNILAPLWTGFIMQRAGRNCRPTTLGLSLACWRTRLQKQLEAKHTIKLCKASDPIPSNAILLTAKLSLIALTFAQSRPLPSAHSFLRNLW